MAVEQNETPPPPMTPERPLPPPKGAPMPRRETPFMKLCKAHAARARTERPKAS